MEAQMARPAPRNDLRPVTGDGVNKIFFKGDKGLRAVQDATFRMEAGQFTSVIGPSGCGKSTLLRMIAGLDSPTRGTLRLGDEVIEGTRSSVGIMLQSPTLFPWRTARANVLLPIEVHRKVTKADERRAMEILDLVGLAGFENHYPHELSGGMQQRVALSRLLVTDPEVMLLDEPFGALDEFTRERLNVELAAIVRETGKTAVLVTHNITEAVFMSDRIIAMAASPGRIVDVIDVPFPHPRTAGLMKTQEFTEIVFAVRSVLGIEES